ncbi:MAG: hypothetical protein ABJA61_06770 [Caldimonas sp.]
MLDWQRIGLETPTADRQAIKRAYALKLRVTRPDDDAAAYQLLREAYDRLIQRSRAAGEDARPDPAPDSATDRGEDLPLPEDEEQTALPTLRGEAEPTAPPTFRSESVASSEPLPAIARAAPSRSAAQLCELVVSTFEAGGPAAVTALVPEITRALSVLPLQAHTEAAFRFAHLVIERNRLPSELLLCLRDHFDWLDDFRIARVLGPQGCEALESALSELPRKLNNNLLRFYADTFVVAAMLQLGKRRRAALVAALMGFPLRRQVATAGPAMLRRLGIDVAGQAELSLALRDGDRWRVAVLALSVFVAAWLCGADLIAAAVATAFGLFGGLMALGLAVKTIEFAYRLRARRILPARWLAPERLARLRNWLPWLGVALVGLGAAGLRDFGTDYGAAIFVAAALCALVGWVLAVPLAMDQALVATALILFTGLSLRTESFGVWAAAATWVLGCVQLYLRGAHRRLVGAVEQRGWEKSGLTAVAASIVLGFVGLPIVVSWAAVTAGFRIVLSALLIASVPLFLYHGERNGPIAWFALLILLPTLLVLQALLLKLGRRLGARFSAA